MAFQDFRGCFKEVPRDERGIAEREPRNLLKTTAEIPNAVPPRSTSNISYHIHMGRFGTSLFTVNLIIFSIFSSYC